MLGVAECGDFIADVVDKGGLVADKVPYLVERLPPSYGVGPHVRENDRSRREAEIVDVVPILRRLNVSCSPYDVTIAELAGIVLLEGLLREIDAGFSPESTPEALTGVREAAGAALAPRADGE